MTFISDTRVQVATSGAINEIELPIIRLQLPFLRYIFRKSVNDLFCDFGN